MWRNAGVSDVFDAHTVLLCFVLQWYTISYQLIFIWFIYPYCLGLLFDYPIASKLVFKDKGKIELWQSNTKHKRCVRFYWDFTNHFRIIIPIWYNSPSLQDLLSKLISNAISVVWIGHSVKQCTYQPAATNIALVFYKCWQKWHKHVNQLVN